jgi:hypothetical protein
MTRLAPTSRRNHPNKVPARSALIHNSRLYLQATSLERLRTDAP